MYRRHLRFALAGGLALSLLGAPAPAMAVPGIQRVVGATASAVVTSHTLTLTCPAGKIAVGAGAGIIGSALDTHITGLWPSGNTVTLTAASERNPATAAWALQGMGICASPGTEFQTVVSPVGTGAVEAVCPAGKTVLGLGARVTSGRLVYAIPFNPSGGSALTLVTGAAAPTSSGAPASLQVKALCGNSSRNSQLVKAQTVGTGAVHTASATCPAGTQLHSFGGYNHYPNSTTPASYALFTAFTSALASPQLAVVTSREKVDNIPPQTWGVDIWAVCAP